MVPREWVDVAGNPLSIIFERLWQSGEVPTIWKRSSIAPNFQKDPENYRPVRLTSDHICKGYLTPNKLNLIPVTAENIKHLPG